jgi:hypothetical protein
MAHGHLAKFILFSSAISACPLAHTDGLKNRLSVKNIPFIFYIIFAPFLHVDYQLIFLTSSQLLKGKPLERVGRKATGLSLYL